MICPLAQQATGESGQSKSRPEDIKAILKMS